ncbi:MAG: phosphodiester glycosidase family protein, partial [Clostridia bacterium]|nr:phosphodiester glycosidase family protein [Clostridia bacterium]
VGLKISDMPELCKKLGFENCFLVDGGGSSTLLKATGEDTYEIVNVPSDKFDDGTYGRPRTVVNSIILSFIDESLLATPEPEPTAPEETQPEPAATPEQNSGNKKGCGSSLAESPALCVTFSVAFAAALPSLIKRKKNTSE